MQVVTILHSIHLEQPGTPKHPSPLPEDTISHEDAIPIPRPPLRRLDSPQLNLVHHHTLRSPPSLTLPHSIYPNGTVVHDRKPDPAQGANGTGIILYHPSMHMSAILTPTLPEYRPHDLQYGKFENTTDAQWAVLGKHNLAYSAPFTLSVLPEDEEDDGVVTHGPLLSNVPSYDGAYFVRNFTVVGEGGEYGKWLQLKIRNETSGIRNVILWKKRE